MKKILSLFLSIVMLITMTVCFSSITEAAESWLWPVPSSQQINQYYSSSHDGLDIGGATNCSVVASMSGTVVYSRYGDYPNEYTGGGNFVVIQHSNGYYSHYAHLNSRSVSEGQSVSQGQEIGKMGSTGNSTGTHLHFAIATSKYGAGGRINNNPDTIKYSYGTIPSDLKFNINNTTNITENSATVNFSISNPSNQTVSKVGMKIKKSSESNWSKTYEETLPSSIYNSSTLTTTYVIGSGKEVNYTLSAGTEYTWIAYAVVGSKTYTSGNNKFTTKPSSASTTTKPTTTTNKCSKGHTAGTATVTKATLTDNGSIDTKCTVCGATINSETIYAPDYFKLSTSSYTYDGKIKKPSITVYDNDGGIIEKENYTVSYASGRKSVGKYVVTVNFKGNYSGEKTVYFTIKPKSTSLSSVKAGSKKLTVKWKKQTSQTTGYQIQYSTSSNFTSPKTVTVSKNGTTSNTISKLKSKKKYYVRVRTYKNVKVDDKTTKIYSSWSKSKSIKTK